MTRSLLGVGLVGLAIAVCATDAQAFGRRGRGGCCQSSCCNSCGGCYSGGCCGGGCYSGDCCGGGCGSYGGGQGVYDGAHHGAPPARMPDGGYEKAPIPKPGAPKPGDRGPGDRNPDNRPPSP